MRYGLAVCLAVCVSVPAFAETVFLSLEMDGPTANRCEGTDSPATGSGTFVLDTESGALRYDIQYTEGQLLAPETVAHIHGPALPCENAPPVVTLNLGARKEGEATLSPAQVRDILGGLYYVNVHSEMHPGGEIRGQIVAAINNPVPASSPWGLFLTLSSLLGLGALLLRSRS